MPKRKREHLDLLLEIQLAQPLEGILEQRHPGIQDLIEFSDLVFAMDSLARPLAVRATSLDPPATVGMPVPQSRVDKRRVALWADVKVGHPASTARRAASAVNSAKGTILAFKLLSTYRLLPPWRGVRLISIGPIGFR